MKENTIKAALAAALGALCAYGIQLLVPVLVLLVVMVLDYITGMAKAWHAGELSSRVGLWGILKKVGYLVIVGVACVVDWLLRYGADSLIERGAVRRTLLSALQDCGLWSGPMPRPEEELRRQTQEFEWAYGDEAEERMEQLAAQTLQTLEHTESADRPEQLEHLIHSGRWHGEIDRDAFISHLEEHIAELVDHTSRPEVNARSQPDRQRAHLSEKLRREHPELAQRMAEHREELRRHLHARYPELADHIEDLRKKYENDQD